MRYKGCNELTLDIYFRVQIRQNLQTILIEMDRAPGIHPRDENVTVPVHFLYLQRRHFFEALTINDEYAGVCITTNGRP